MEIEHPEYFGQLLLKKGFRVWFKYMFRAIEGKKFIEEDIHADLLSVFDKLSLFEIIRLIVNIPPRSGKTTMAKYFIAFCLAENPYCNFIYTSYSQSLLSQISDELIKILEHPIYKSMYPHQFSKENQDEDPIDEFWKEYLKKETGKPKYSGKKITTNVGGVILFASVGASITGFGAGIRGFEGFGGALIIDDGNKPADINSEVMRKKVHSYFEETLLSRLNDSNTPIINIQQRLHVYDLSGFLISNYKFVLLKKPLIVDGECQIKSQYNEERLAEVQENKYVFSSQYQQEPVMLNGLIFNKDHFLYVRYLPRMEYRAIYADFANKTKQENDFTVLECWGVYQNKAYLLDQERGKWELPTALMKCRAFWDKHKLDENHGTLRKFAIEDKQNGTGAIQILKDEKKIPVVMLLPIKDKVMRANDITPRFESGQVYFYEGLRDLADIENELLSFPNGEHDDIVDVLTYAIKDLLFNNGKPDYIGAFGNKK